MSLSAKTRTDYVEKLIEKAAISDESGEAMRFAQAALNAANAVAVLDEVQFRDHAKPK